MNRLTTVCVLTALCVALLWPAPGTVTAAVDPHVPDASPADVRHGDGNQAQDAPSVQLTEKQKKRLAKQYERLFKDHAALIRLYAEYGVITEEQKTRKLALLQKRLERIKANGYLPCVGKHGKKPDVRQLEPNKAAEQ